MDSNSLEIDYQPVEKVHAFNKGTISTKKFEGDKLEHRKVPRTAISAIMLDYCISLFNKNKKREPIF